MQADGTPLVAVASAPAKPATPYDAGDRLSFEIGSWAPGLLPADEAYQPGRNTTVARAHDLVANNGWASGAIERETSAVVGSNIRLSAWPNYRALGLDEDWAAEFSEAAEAKFKMYTDDPGRYCDVRRLQTFGEQAETGYRDYRVAGEATAVMHWLPGRGGPYATATQLIDPDRLSNPNNMHDTENMRGGKEVDSNGAVLRYHFRKQHPNSRRLFGRNSHTWEAVNAETPWGRPIVIHVYEHLRSEMHRGVSGLTSVIKRLKMEDKYGSVELQAAILNAILCAFVESAFDPTMIGAGMDQNGASFFQQQRNAFYSGRTIALGGVQMPHLFPGDKIGFQNVQRPAGQFADFEAAVLRNISSGLGLTYEQVSGDWSKTTYSSARAALQEIWRTFRNRRSKFARGFCTPIYLAWLEECIDLGDLPLPRNAPDFIRFRAAYAQCEWIGPPQGYIDPLKEITAAGLRVAMQLSTLKDEAAAQGRDHQDTQDQLMREIRAGAGKDLVHPAQKDFLSFLVQGAFDQNRREDEEKREAA